MRYLLFLLLTIAFLSCGNNNDGGGDDDEIKPPLDTTLTPPTDTLGVDSVVTALTLRQELEMDTSRMERFSEYWFSGLDSAASAELNRRIEMEQIGKRKGVDQTQEKSIVYYQLVKRTFKYKIQ